MEQPGNYREERARKVWAGHDEGFTFHSTREGHLKANLRRSTTSDPYGSEAQTKELLRRSSVYRRQRISASDMVTTNEAAALSGGSRLEVISCIKSGRYIGVRHLSRGFKVPKWQFEPYAFPAIQAISHALGTTDGWKILSFLETPHEALDGLTPRIAMERGVPYARVVDLATAEAH